MASPLRSTAQLTRRTAKRQPAALSYFGVYCASPLERIEMIRRGIPSSEARRILADLAIGHSTALRALMLPTATAGKKARQEHTLSAAESERVIGIVALVGQLEAMIQESGHANREIPQTHGLRWAGEGFDAPSWMSRWLQEPLPSLGGRLPIDLMDTMEGQALVSTAIAQMRGEPYA